MFYFIIHSSFSLFISCLVCPAGHLLPCWFLYNVHVNPFPKALLVKLNSNSFPKVFNPFSKVWSRFQEISRFVLGPFPKGFL